VNTCLKSHDPNPLIHKRYFRSFISTCTKDTTHLHLSPTQCNHLQGWHTSPTGEVINHSTVMILWQLHWWHMQILTDVSEVAPTHKQTKASMMTGCGAPQRATSRQEPDDNGTLHCLGGKRHHVSWQFLLFLMQSRSHLKVLQSSMI
jgi:hypothetical protein